MVPLAVLSCFSKKRERLSPVILILGLCLKRTCWVVSFTIKVINPVLCSNSIFYLIQTYMPQTLCTVQPLILLLYIYFCFVLHSDTKYWNFNFKKHIYTYFALISCKYPMQIYSKSEIFVQNIVSTVQITLTEVCISKS